MHIPGLAPAPEGHRYVIRFEAPNGLGPWKSGAVHDYDDHHRCRNEYHSAGDMPSPWDEGGHLGMHHRARGCEGYVFAFSSRTQLKRAFPSSVGRVAMAEKGRRCFPYVYLVPDLAVVEGTAQVMFAEEYRGEKVALLDPRTLSVALYLGQEEAVAA